MDILPFKFGARALASHPINHREHACRALLASTLIASRTVEVGGHTATLCGGASRLTSIGRALDPIFPPASAVHNGIVGVSVPFGKVTFFLEHNPGGIQCSGGMGALYVFPQHAPPAASAPPADESSVKRNSL
jgi:hypothetical protein